MCWGFPPVKFSSSVCVHSKARTCFVVLLNLKMHFQNNVHIDVHVCGLRQRVD